MISVMLASVAGLLLAAGFAWGSMRGARVAHSTRSTPRRTWAVIVGTIGLFLLLTLMLAKLFHSDVLGWVFGLTLMTGTALLPFAALIYLGVQIGKRSSRSRRPVNNAEVNTVVLIESDGVHASDDAPSMAISLSPDMTLRALVARVISEGGLPRISGGKATWVVRSSGAGLGPGSCTSRGPTLRPVAVYAEQWAEPAFLVAADVSAAAHFGTAQPLLHFNYRAQQDPEVVLAAQAVHRM